MDPILKTEALCAFYDKKQILFDLCLSVPAHKITAIIGPSGCGKSTLLKCMNGILPEEPGAYATGTVTLGGTPIGEIPANELRRRVGLVFQQPAPFPFSIYKNMTYAPVYYGERDRKKLDAIVREKLTLAGLYEEVSGELSKSALKLSGGQQQRLCIARALTAEPEILLLDEPCSATDPVSTAAIEKTLVSLKELCTIVIVTHNIAQARRIADNFVFLYNGRLTEQGPGLLENPQMPETVSFLSGRIG